VPMVSDDGEYSDQAEQFAHHFPGGTPYYWPPGAWYVRAGPYALLGSVRGVARATMIVVSLLAVVVTALLARRVLRDERAARLSGWALALFPSAILMPAEPYSFDLTMLAVAGTALAVLTAYDLRKWLYLAVGGLALGIATVTRPSSLSLAIPLLVLLVIVVRRLWREGQRVQLRGLAGGSLAFVACMAAVIVPAMQHNAARGEGWTISTNNEGNVWLGNNPYTPNYKTSELGQHPVSEFSPPVRRYLQRFTSRPNEREAQREEALRYIGEHPANTLLRTINRIREFWGFDYTFSRDIENEWGVGVKGLVATLPFEAGGYALLALLAIVGAVAAQQMFQPSRALFLLLLTIGYQLPYTVAFAGGRWHFPVIPLVVPFAGAGLAWLASTGNAWVEIKQRRAVWAFAAMFMAVQIEYAYFTLGTSP